MGLRRAVDFFGQHPNQRDYAHRDPAFHSRDCVGVQFYFNTPVQRIIHQKGLVKGVVVNDENKLADVVVSNVDAYFTYKNLLGNTVAVTVVKAVSERLAAVYEPVLI